MNNKKLISLLLSLAMVFTVICPAFATVTSITTDQPDTPYSYGATVEVSGKADASGMYALSTKINGYKNIIIMDSFVRNNDGTFNFDIELPTSDVAGAMWPAGTYTIETAEESTTFEIAKAEGAPYNITVADKKNGTTTVVNSDGDKIEEGETGIAAAGSTVQIKVDPDSKYEVGDVVVKTTKGSKIKTTKKSSKYTFTMPEDDVTVTVTYAKDSGNGGGSSGGIVINNGMLGGATTGSMIVVLNPNQYSKYGVDANAVSATGAKLSANTFTVAVSINGTKYVTFDGYNPVMVKVPFAPAAAANTNNIVVVDQYGNVVPRSMYKNGYMYVAMNDTNGVFSIVELTETFTDTNIDWANTAISALAARDIINGMGDGTFAPYDTVTRAQFIKMIVSMLDVNNTSSTASFADIAGDEWYAPYVATAKEYGITLGYAEDNTFRPNNIITREEMSAMLYRAADVMTVELTPVKEAVTFADDAYIQDYAKTAVYKMQTAGVLQGVGNNMFDAKGSCTRAQAAVAIWNMFQVTMNF